MRRGERARELLPTILLTLLSVVQALALEAAWSSAREMTFLFEGGVPAAVGWLQVLAIFQGIVVIWLFYIGIVMRFSWVPTTWDSLAPFVLGAGELAMVQLMELQLIPYWFYVLAAIFGFSTWVSNRMFLAGHRDNQKLDVDLPISSRFDRLVPYGFVLALVVMGVIVHAIGSDGATAVACVALANTLLLAQAWMIQRYWAQWVGGIEG